MKSAQSKISFPRTALGIGVGTGMLLGASWLTPGTFTGSLLGWAAAFGIVAGVRRTDHAVLTSTLTGVVSHIIAFYWFFHSVKSFTETSNITAAFITAPFLAWHVLQFVLFAVLYGALPSILNSWGIRVPLAWVSLEWVWPRLFPWCLGSTQVGFTHLAQATELVGTFGLGFLMLSFAENCYARVTKRDGLRLRTQGALFASILLFGVIRIHSLKSTMEGVLQVGVVQSGSDDQKRGDGLYEHSEAIAGEVDLLVWPERALKSSIHESIGHRDNDPRLPRFSAPLIAGAKTYRPPHKTFNSVIYIERDGSIPVPYHKRMLMPFGEYLPYPSLFDFLGLSSLAPKSTHTAGTTPTLFTIPIRGGNQTVKVAPLICYEDLRPELSTLAVSKGASLLIDLSAGGWSDVSLPAYQHQALAMMRAIESRRTLLRLSGKGPSSYVDPTGKIHPIFGRHEEGARIVSVPLTSTSSFFPVTAHWVPVIVALFTVFSLVGRVTRFRVSLTVPEKA